MEAAVVEAVMKPPTGAAMEPPAVPSAGVGGSSKREGKGGDEDEAHDLLHDQLLPTGPMAAKPAVVPRAQSAHPTFLILTLEAAPRILIGPISE